MNKNDNSFLYTGSNSRSYSEKKTRREIQVEDKIEKRAKLQPAAKIVIDLIDTEKKLVSDISTLVMGVETSKDDLKSALLARKFYTQYLTDLQYKLQIILKPKKEKDE